MPGLLIMTALGHAGVKSPTDLENLVQSGLDYSAHAGNVDHSGHSVIDEAQGITSNVWSDAGELPVVLSAQLPHMQSSVSHTWRSSQLSLKHVFEQTVPYQDGWF